MRLAIAALAMVCIRTDANGAPPKTTVVPAPPQPVEQQASVKRGGSVDIPLRIYGTRAQTLEWLIRQRPAHGKLSNLRSTAPEAALVTYTPPVDLRVVADRFTFSVRSNEGVSATAEVRIAIIDEPPLLVVPAEIDFGTLLVGGTSTKSLELSNGGGGLAEGEWIVDLPWRAAGARHYKLAAGEHEIAKIDFAPTTSGEFESEIRFSSHLDRTTTVKGVALALLAVEPAALLLKNRPGNPQRAGEFALLNHTDESFDVTLIASQRLKFPPTVHLPAHGRQTVVLQTSDDDVAAIDEPMRFAAGDVEAHMLVKANATPAIVLASPENVAFGPLLSGVIAKEKIVVRNIGGVAAQLTLGIAAPFSVDEKQFALNAGAAREITLAVAATAPGRIQNVLQVTGGERELAIPVEANIAQPGARPTAAPKPSSAEVPLEGREPSLSPQPAVALAAKVVASGKDYATFEWTGEIPSGTTLRCRRRVVDLVGSNLSANYEDYPDCSFERRGDTNVATVRKLPPAETHFFRIDAIDASGQTTTPVTFAQVRTPARDARWPRISLLRVLCLLALLAGGAALWQRRWRSSGL